MGYRVYKSAADRESPVVRIPLQRHHLYLASVPTSAAQRARPATTARFDGVASHAPHPSTGTKKAHNSRPAVARATESAALVALTLWALLEELMRSGVPTGVRARGG